MAAQPIRITTLASALTATLLITAGNRAAAQDATENRFEGAIRKFEAADRESPPAENGVLFVGSSSIRFWDLKKSFPELDAINRGFGGSEISDSIHFARRIVINYHPRTIVFYAGDNDIAGGKTPAEVFSDFQTFATLVHEALPDTRLLYISIKPSIARWELVDQMREANRLIDDYTRGQDYLTFIDIDAAMLGADGRPREELFITDGLHLNPAGYELWASILRPRLADAPPPQAPRRRDPALAPIDDVPGLPRVLLIGDSISVGYTLPVRKRLAGVANVHRIPANGGPTTRGLQEIDAWLGDGAWDVIHFNWGLHDLRRESGTPRVPLAEYERNLKALVARLQKTGAVLVWASTTPVPEGAANRKFRDVVEYNAAAERIMRQHDVAIDDLYGFALPQLDAIQRPANVHFTPEGSAKLAEQVAAQIEQALAAHQE